VMAESRPERPFILPPSLSSSSGLRKGFSQSKNNDGADVLRYEGKNLNKRAAV
jgi:hypothetical protein